MIVDKAGLLMEAAEADPAMVRFHRSLLPSGHETRRFQPPGHRAGQLSREPLGGGDLAMQLTQRIIGVACIAASLFFAKGAADVFLGPDLPVEVPWHESISVFAFFLVLTLLLGIPGVAAVLNLGRAHDGLLAPRTFRGIGFVFSFMAFAIGVPFHRRIPGHGTVILLVLVAVAVACFAAAILRSRAARTAA